MIEVQGKKAVHRSTNTAEHSPSTTLPWKESQTANLSLTTHPLLLTRSRMPLYLPRTADESVPDEVSVREKA